MPLNFPTGISVGYIYTFDGRSWQWNGSGWDSYSAATNPVTSLNGLTGSVGLSGGTSISITPTGNTLTIAYTGGAASGVTKYVETVNGLTGNVTVAAKVAGAIGVNLSGQNIFIENQGVKSLGFTGTKGIQVQSAAGQGNTGDLQFTITYTPSTVSSFKSQATPTGATGDVVFTQYVASFNGLTGEVTGVTTGTANTFGPLQNFTSGISASGITIGGIVNIKNDPPGSGYITVPAGGNNLNINGGGTPSVTINESNINLDNVIGNIKIGDVNNSFNSHYVAVSDTNLTIDINAPQGIVTIGDVNSVGAFTKITVDDSSNTISFNGLINSAFDSGVDINDRMMFFDASIATPALKKRTWFDYTGQFYTRLPISAAGISASGGVTFSGTVASDTGYRITSNAINSQTGTTYTFVAADNGKIVTFNNNSSITVTVPTALPVGFNCTAIQLGTGQVGFTNASGLTLQSYGNQYKLIGQHASATLREYATNIVNLSGNLSV